MPPPALCACLRCHTEGNWGKTDCTCTCYLKFKDGFGVKPTVGTLARNAARRDYERRITKDVGITYPEQFRGTKVTTTVTKRSDNMGEFPALSFDQIKSQALGFVYGCGVVVVLALAGELSDVESFENIGLAGLGLTALRSAASFVTLFFTQRNVGGK